MYSNSFNLSYDELNILYFTGDVTVNVTNFIEIIKKCLIVYNTLFTNLTYVIDINIRFPYIYDLLIMFNNPTGKYILQKDKKLYNVVMNKFNELSESPLYYLEETNKQKAIFLVDEIAPLYSSLSISV